MNQESDDGLGGVVLSALIQGHERRPRDPGILTASSSPPPHLPVPVLRIRNRGRRNSVPWPRAAEYQPIDPAEDACFTFCWEMNAPEMDYCAAGFRYRHRQPGGVTSDDNGLVAEGTRNHTTRDVAVLFFYTAVIIKYCQTQGISVLFRECS